MNFPALSGLSAVPHADIALGLFSTRRTAASPQAADAGFDLQLSEPTHGAQLMSTRNRTRCASAQASLGSICKGRMPLAEAAVSGTISPWVKP